MKSPNRSNSKEGLRSTGTRVFLHACITCSSRRIQTCGYYISRFLCICSGRFFYYCIVIWTLQCSLTCRRDVLWQTRQSWLETSAASLCRLLLLLFKSKLPVASSYLEKKLKFTELPLLSLYQLVMDFLERSRSTATYPSNGWVANPPLQLFLTFSPVFVQDPASFWTVPALQVALNAPETKSSKNSFNILPSKLAAV